MIATHIGYVAAVSQDVPQAAGSLENGLGMVRAEVTIDRITVAKHLAGAQAFLPIKFHKFNVLRRVR